MMRAALFVALLGLAHGADQDAIIKIVQGQLDKSVKSQHDNEDLHIDTTTANDKKLKEALLDKAHAQEDYDSAVASEQAAEAASQAALNNKRAAQAAKEKLQRAFTEEKSAEAKDAKNCAARIEDAAASTAALSKALNALQSGSGSVDLMQMNKKDPRISHVISLLNTGKEGRAYGSKNAGVIDLVSDMHDDFKKEQNTIEIECMNLKNNHAMEMQSLQNQKSNKAQEEQEEDGRQTEQAASAANYASQAANLNVALQTASKEEASARGAIAAEEHRFKSESAENKNMISGLMTSLAQLKGKFFIQLSSDKDVKERVVAMLDQGALTYKSKILAQLAVRASAAGGFKKIVEMIEDMISNLKKEAAEDAAKNAGCVTDIAEAEESMKQEALARESADATFNEQMAVVEQKDKDIGDMATKLRRLTKTMSNNDKRENQRKTAFQNARDGMKDTIAKITKAVSSLQETKNKAADTDTSLDDVITMVEGVKNSVQDTLDAAEDEDTKAVTEYQQERSTNAAVKKADTTFKAQLSSDRTSAQEAKVDAENLRAEKQARHDDATKRLQDTNLLCRPPPVPLKERLAQRNNEIDQLKNVMEVLRNAHN